MLYVIGIVVLVVIGGINQARREWMAQQALIDLGKKVRR